MIQCQYHKIELTDDVFKIVSLQGVRIGAGTDDVF